MCYHHSTIITQCTKLSSCQIQKTKHHSITIHQKLTSLCQVKNFDVIRINNFMVEARNKEIVEMLERSMATFSRVVKTYIQNNAKGLGVRLRIYWFSWINFDKIFPSWMAHSSNTIGRFSLFCVMSFLSYFRYFSFGMTHTKNNGTWKMP